MNPARNKLAAVVRAAAVLPAAGAYDTTPATVNAAAFAAVGRLLFVYTPGASGGAFKYRIEGSVDGTTWGFVTVRDNTNTTSGNTTTTTAYVDEVKLPANGSTATNYVSPPIDLRGIQYVRVGCAEYGQTGTPGTLTVTVWIDRGEG